MSDDPPMDPGLSPDIVDAGGLEITVAEAEASDIASTPRTLRPWGPWATIGWTALGIVTGLAIQTAVVIAYVVVRMAGNPKADLSGLASDGTLLGVVTLATTPAIVGLMALLARVRGFTVRDYLALEWPKPRHAALAVAGLVFFLAASDLTTYMLGREIVPPFMVDAYRTAWLPLLLLALLVLAPLGEEVLIRGFLFRGLAASRLGPGMAIGICSVVWAAMHIQYDLYGIALIFLMGLYLGAVRYLTGSLLLTMILHFLANVAATAEVIVKVEWLG